MADPATLRQNTEDLLVRVIAGGETELVERIVHPDFFNHEADPERSRGLAGAAATAEWLRSCFGEISWEIHHVLVDGDLAAAPVTMRGTRAGCRRARRRRTSRSRRATSICSASPRTGAP